MNICDHNVAIRCIVSELVLLISDTIVRQTAIKHTRLRCYCSGVRKRVWQSCVSGQEPERNLVNEEVTQEVSPQQLEEIRRTLQLLISLNKHSVK